MRWYHTSIEILLGRPAFSIDSLLQRKVVHNSDQGIERNVKERDEINLRDSFPISSTIHSRSSSQPTPLVASSMSPRTNNPLDSLTFENILRSAAFQQNRSRGKNLILPVSLRDFSEITWEMYIQDIYKSWFYRYNWYNNSVTRGPTTSLCW